MSFNINIGRWLIGPYCGESWLSPLSWWNYRERFPFWKSSVSMPGDLFFSIGPIYFSRSECNIGRLIGYLPSMIILNAYPMTIGSLRVAGKAKAKVHLLASS